jgi:hypothetical protein
MSRAHGTIAIQERQGIFLPLAAAPPTRPARRGSPVDAPQSQAERGAAQSGHAAQDGREEGQQGCPGAPSGKIAAAGARSPGFGRGRGPRATGLCCGVRVTIGVSFFLAG